MKKFIYFYIVLVVISFFIPKENVAIKNISDENQTKISNETLLNNAKDEIYAWALRNKIHKSTKCEIAEHDKKNFIVCFPDGGAPGVTHGQDGYLFLVDTDEINNRYKIYEVFIWERYVNDETEPLFKSKYNIGFDRVFDKTYDFYPDRESINWQKIFKRL